MRSRGAALIPGDTPVSDSKLRKERDPAPPRVWLSELETSLGPFAASFLAVLVE